MRVSLESASIHLEGYLGRNGYVARLPEGGLARARELPGLDWAAPYHPGLRIAPEILGLDEDDPRSSVPLLLLATSGADDDSFRPGVGYWILTFQPGLTLLVAP